MTTKHAHEQAEAPAVRDDAHALAQRIQDAIDGNPNSALQVAAIAEVLTEFRGGHHHKAAPQAAPAEEEPHGRRRHS